MPKITKKKATKPTSAKPTKKKPVKKKAIVKSKNRSVIELMRVIEKWIEDNKVKGKKGEIEIKDIDGEVIKTEPATIFGDVLAIHASPKGVGDPAKANQRVSHVGTGGNLSDFPNEHLAKEFVFIVLNLFHWDFFDPKNIPNPADVRPIIKLCQEEGIADDALKSLVEMIERNQK